MEIYKIMGKRIEKGRRLRGLLQHDFGAAMGRSESWVSQVERGVIALDSLSMAERMAVTLRLPVDHLSKADAYEGSDLVRLGRHVEALPSLDKAIEQLSPEMLRHRCTAYISRAEAHAGANNIEAACEDGHAALALVAQVQHRATLRRVSALHRGLRSHKTAGTRSLGEHLIDTRTLLKITGSAA